MIFDSPHVRALVAKCADQPDFRVPQIVGLARNKKLMAEREDLEALVGQVPEKKQRDWLGRLSSHNDDQHLGAWFEIKLFGWLKQVGDTVVEPSVEGDAPDFSVMLGDLRVMIEARACGESEAERERHRREAEVIWTIRQIQMPYAVTIRKLQWGGKLDSSRCVSEVLSWLQHSPAAPLVYVDIGGTRIWLEAQHLPSLNQVGVAGPVTSGWANPNVVKPALREKASQHKRLRRSGHPYLLALFLESWLLSAEEVAAAWFGNMQVLVDLESGQAVGERLDRSGIHFYHSEVRHRSVSGTLVFRKRWLGSPYPIELRAWYIENPFALVAVDASRLPVEGRFVVVGRDDDELSMTWQASVQTV